MVEGSVFSFSLSGTIVVKLFMWLYCLLYRKKSSSVRALATDHISDVVSNSFLLFCYLISIFFWPYMDPLGGIAISFFLMYNWYQEGSIEVKKLSGQSAPPEFLSKITFLVWNHSKMIISVDTVRAFHLANGNKDLCVVVFFFFFFLIGFLFLFEGFLVEVVRKIDVDLGTWFFNFDFC